MLHTLMFAAAFIAASSSELKNTRMVAVSLVEEWETITTGQAKQTSSQQLLPKTPGREIASANHAAREAPPVVPQTRDQSLTASESEVRQSLPPENNDSVEGSSSVQMTSNPAAGHTVSPAGSGTEFISQGNSTVSTYSTPVASGGGQQPSSAGSASLRQKIRAALQANLIYPYIARKRQMEGSVMVSFRIDQSGNPESIRILKGSGYSILDSAARDTVVKASPFPAANNRIEVPITFTLKDH